MTETEVHDESKVKTKLLYNNMCYHYWLTCIESNSIERIVVMGTIGIVYDIKVCHVCLY